MDNDDNRDFLEEAENRRLLHEECEGCNYCKTGNMDFGSTVPKTIQIPRLGTKATYEGKLYEIVETATYQEQPYKLGHSPIITTICTILALTPEGKDAGKTTKKCNLVHLVII